MRISPGAKDSGYRAGRKGVLLALTCAALLTVCGLGTGVARAEEELVPPQYVWVVDEAGRHIFSTGHVLRSGDEILASDNRRYRITRVEQNRAVARLIGEEDLGALLGPGDEEAIARLVKELEEKRGASAASSSAEVPWWKRIKEIAGRIARGDSSPVQKPGKTVGIYHTHSDESYEPTQGTASVEGKGGVFAVGESLAAKLRDKGITPLHDKSLYLPHDGRAYERSRRGAANLAATRPLALLDVHRDSGPAEEYVRDIAGKPASQVMIVVGKQNPGASANASFAEKLKTVADRMYPGLVRGILYTQGKFNQDIHPRNLLIEVGTEKVSQEVAQRGASLLADALPVAAGAVAPAVGGGREAAGALRALWWILGLAVVAGGGYLWLSTGSLEEARRRLRTWLGEITVAGDRRRRRG